MLFTQLAHYLEELEATSSRLEMMYQLAKLFVQLPVVEIKPACYLLQGQLLPPYESLEFGVSVKTLIKAIARVKVSSERVEKAPDLFGLASFSEAEAEVTKKYKQIGDLGTVLAGARPAASIFNQNQPTISQVYQRLFKLTDEKGAGSQDRKLQLLVSLFDDLDAVSAKFVVRIVLAKLRLGFSTMTMIDALSWAMTQSKAEASLLEDAYQRQSDIGVIAEVYLASADAEKRQQVLGNLEVVVGTPLVPALCQRLNSAEEIIAKMGTVIAEPKYDGLRIQIHVDKNAEQKVKTFTRNLENTTHMFPELATIIDEINCTTCILDAEGIGYDRETGALLPFQETITRKRKHDVAETAAAIPIRCYIFDLLSVDGESLIRQSLQLRKARLANLFKANEVIEQTPFIITSDPKELHSFHEAKLAEGLEGAVIKQLDSEYQSGRKGWSWVKIKETEGARGKLKDTLDCVVMGYYVGRGKRTAFGVGAFLVGVLNDQQQLKTIAKIGTGLSDDQFRELRTRCQPLEISESLSEYEVPKALVPDVWVGPGLVVEIAADELTRSPVHSAGVALRFPRLVKFRDDKDWTAATTIEELEGIR